MQQLHVLSLAEVRRQPLVLLAREVVMPRHLARDAERARATRAVRLGPALQLTLGWAFENLRAVAARAVEPLLRRDERHSLGLAHLGEGLTVPAEQLDTQLVRRFGRALRVDT
eukprot:4707009-Prymnesium_polylepis.1